jgi:hypothetical protein
MPSAKTRRRPDPAKGRPRPGRRPDRRRFWTFVALGIIALVSLARVPHLGFPLERDEGEFGYIAQQLLHGVPVYVSAYTQKLPGAYYMYALILALFGQSAVAIHLGLLLANAAIMGLIFLTLRKTHGGLAGCVGALVFGVMALSPPVLGFATHATFFIALFSMAGLYALLQARDRNSMALYLVSGLCCGLAFLMKQSGIFFAPLLLAFLAWDAYKTQPRRLARFATQAGLFTAGALAPIFLTTAYYLAIGQISLFLFWPFRLAREFGSQVGFADGLKNLRDQTVAVTSGFAILWVVAFASLVAMLRDTALGRNRYLYLAFGAACILSIVPGFFFTNHYYVSVLPYVAILIGGLVATATRAKEGSGQSFVRSVAVGAVVAVGLLVGFARFEPFYTARMSDVDVSRLIYRGNPFPESIEIASYLRDHTSPQDSIGILGSETQIYFYAQRPSASRFVNGYFLTADHPRNRDMQREMIRDLERTRPRYLVLVNMALSWMARANSPRDIFEWFDRYRSGYVVEGVVQMQRGGGLTTWGPDARAVSPSGEYIEILRRMD